MSSELSATSPEYRQWLVDLKGRFRQVQLKAAVAVKEEEEDDGGGRGGRAF